MLQNTVPLHRDYASNEVLMIPKRDALILCGITRKFTCAFATEIFVTKQRGRALPVMF